MSKKIPIVFHNGSNYDYPLIIKESVEEFNKQFTCLGNTEKYITFTVSSKKLQQNIGGKNTTKYILHIKIY